MLVISSSQEEAKEYVLLIRDLFGFLGLIINERKSQLEPSQEVSEGTETAHQCLGADNSAPSNSDLHKGEEVSTHSGENRQYYSQVLHQSYRGNSLSISKCHSFKHMELVPGASPSFVSGVPSRSGKPDSGCGVETLRRPLRLDASSTGVRADKQLNGPTGCGSLCIQANAPITKVFQLEARPGSGGHGRVHTELELDSRLCKSPVVSDSGSTDQNSSGGSKNSAGGSRWKTQPWYPLLLDMLTDVSCLLPRREDLVISPSEREFIMPAGVPQLAAWPLSGKSADREAFQQKLHGWSQLYCVPNQHHLMNPPLGNGTAGVWNGLEIPLRAL